MCYRLKFMSSLKGFLILLIIPAFFWGRHEAGAKPHSTNCHKDSLDKLEEGENCLITDLGIFYLFSPQAARNPEEHKDLGANSSKKTVRSTIALKVLQDMSDDELVTTKDLKRFAKNRDIFSLTPEQEEEFNRKWKEVVKEYEEQYDSIETSVRGHDTVSVGTDPHDHVRQVIGYDEPEVGAHADKKAVLDFANRHYDISNIEVENNYFKINAEKVKGLTMRNTDVEAPKFNIGELEGDLNLEGSHFRAPGHIGAIFEAYSTYQRYDPTPSVKTVIKGSVNAKNLDAPKMWMGTNRNKVTFKYNDKKADFSNAKLNNARFRLKADGAYYSRDVPRQPQKFIFNNSDLTSVDMEEQVLYDEPQFESATLVKANLKSVTAPGANFKSANLTSANLYFSGLEEAQFESANLTSATLSFADLDAAQFESATLLGAKLTRVRAQKANFKSADLKSANLYQADLREAQLDGADLKNASLRETDLRDASLIGTDLRGVSSLDSADLSGAKLKDVIVGPKEYLILKKKGFQDGCCQVRGNCTYQKAVLHIKTKEDSQCGNYCLAVIACETPRIPPVVFTAFCEAESDGNCPIDPNTCAENEPQHKAFVRKENKLWGEETVSSPKSSTTGENSGGTQ